ncbi:heterokaryon incompatibility protein-domain-containing protein [Xylaria bambusicola]|uniref:heterokaryon incompatibility protein-domain-containing protein n=1 Tax=Xylaria bambusicola TaxID=326684 RepID=UPI002007294F|nr:heterokaryon incompatibility protein-domain-containing protein [Xylaria bambusicola]KAI0502773.1 heterokaryon incompatibility protein-domain-containing protein [Xylaria bambusicola]
MWLINTCKLELVFHSSEPPNEYMILSHTWEDGEVTFQDFRDLRFARTKKGFSKIEETCRLARKATLEWAWVDTCCIDKTSSAELSEAINSMFRWYQNAAICCVYLSDLPPEGGNAPDKLQINRHLIKNGAEKLSKGGLDLLHGEVSQDSSDGSMEDSSWTELHLPNCRWFTRGWTLQELLAPRSVLFYDNQWNLRGTKESLKYPLSKITGIDMQALMGSRPLEDYPIAVRMSWCSKRETSRSEDLAYCLLGIFGVYMPMLYGEGTNAFIRLQEEICKTTDDLSIFAWVSLKAPSFHYPYRGLFAISPAEFSACRGLTRFPPSRRRDIGFRVTNNGLTFDKALIYCPNTRRSILLLDCFHQELKGVQNPRPVGIYLAQIGDQFVRHIYSRLYKMDQYTTKKLSVQALNVRKFVSPREAVPLFLESEVAVTLRLPVNTKKISYLPRPQRDSATSLVERSFDELIWAIDDPAYLAYCLFQVDASSWETSHRRHYCSFKALVAWGLDARDGSNKAFVWTEQSFLWPRISGIVDSSPSEERSIWPKNYVLRDLLLEKNQFDKEQQEQLEAKYTHVGIMVVVKAVKNSNGRQLEIKIERPRPYFPSWNLPSWIDSDE